MFSTAVLLVFEVLVVWALWMAVQSLTGTDASLRQIFGKFADKL